MFWDRRRPSPSPEQTSAAGAAFLEALEHAPVCALVLDSSLRVTAANEAARAFFDIDASRLPASLVEVTLESRLLEAVLEDGDETEASLVHRRRSVLTRRAPGRVSGESLLFITDVTELRHLAKVRQEFVANLVHELKTPITALRLTAESLLTDPPPKDRHRFAERIVKEADLISKIIDNLRQLGEIETAAMSIDVSHFDLRELLDETVARAGIDDRASVIASEKVVLATDRAKLAQAISNLLDNASKFSPAGSKIDITVERTDELLIKVRDRGPGISPEHWSRIFERFYKVDRARAREAGGFGLGLAITKHLIQVLGGRIWTEAAQDGGQVFTIALPEQVLITA